MLLTNSGTGSEPKSGHKPAVVAKATAAATAASTAAKVAAAASAITLLAAACSTKSATSTAGAAAAHSTGSATTITVIAAENFWGSIAAQLGGSHVTENSLIANPSTDPHDYEATPADARAVASAQLFIQNGIGYDTAWAPKLVAANPAAGRDVLTVGDVVGLKDGANPHQWYSRAGVEKVVDAIVAEYQKLDPADAAYFAARKRTFETVTLAGYDRLETDIRAKYAGTPIGASESIVSPLADSLGLRMLTPYSFLKDISEGSDPSVADKTLIDQQIAGHEIKVYVYNSQNSTPDIAAQAAEAKSAGIPVTTVTETLAPAGATFQDWMTGELTALETALAQATGR